nr:hypothetical protein [Tanacetum cinerariifolium]
KVKTTAISETEEEVYVCQPPGFEDPDFPDRVYKVENALYGLHQALRAWKEMCTEFEKIMHKIFPMSSIGELTFFLGLQVKQKEDGIFTSQDKYVNEILNKFGFSDVKPASTHMETHKTLLKDKKGKDIDEHLYRSMIGSLMYLTSSRLDIMFALCSCERFQVNPKISHLHAMKRIFRYIRVQPKLGLWYPKDPPFDLVEYTNNDYAGASLDRKSTTGGCQFLGCRLISWKSKKQAVVANSTIEVEDVAALSYRGQLLWIQNQLLDYGYNFMQTKIHIDNESTICIVKNINKEAQLHAKVDGKKVVISKASIKRDLWFGDDGGIDCFSNEFIFEQLTLIGMVKNLDSATKFLMFPRCQDTTRDTIAQIRTENVSNCLIGFNLEIKNTFQAKEIANLKKRVKRLERKRKSRTHGLKRLYKVRFSSRVESSTDEESLGEKDSSKQGRIFDIDANQDIYLVNVYRDEDIFGINGQDDTLMFDDDNDLQGEEVIVKEVNATSIETSVTAAATIAVSFDELTLAQALMKIKTSKPKAKGIVMQEPSEATTTIIIPSIKSQDKGKGIMVEPEMPLKKKAQISLDEEFAFKLQAEEDEQENIIKEKAHHIEEARLFMEFLKKRRKFFAAKRVEEKRNKPPIKAQQRSLMSTYVKNMDGWKTRDLKNKSFAEIKDLFNKEMTRINNFVDFRTELVEESTKKAQAKIAQESSSKRAEDELE